MRDLRRSVLRLPVRCAGLPFSHKQGGSQPEGCGAHLNLKNPTVTGLLKRLDEKGYILCVPNANDKRKKNIYLTEKAYDIQRRMENDRRKLDKELTRGDDKERNSGSQKESRKLLYNIADP